MSLRGDIQTFSLSAIGRLLNQEKKTGILVVRSDEGETKIFFRGGDIVFISGVLAPELSLGALLKEKKLVTDEEIDRSLETAKKEKRRLGVVLLEKGFVSREKLVGILNHQFKESISKVLTWRTGGFFYEDGLDGFVEDIRLKLDPIRLVAEAEKWKAYRALIPNDQVIFQIKEGALRANRFSADGSLRVMLLINGKRDVAQIIAETGLPRLAVYRALAALSAQDAIEIPGGAGVSGPVADADQKTTVVYFMKVIHDITTDIALELGEKKAHSMLSKSMQNAPAGHLFLDAVIPGDSQADNTQRVCDRLKQSHTPPAVEALEGAFRGVLLLLVQEIYHLLGSRAAREVLSKLVAHAEHLQDETRTVAERSLPFFQTLARDDAYLKGNKTLSTGGGHYGGRASASSGRKQTLENTGGAAIIAFYGRIIQIVVEDMAAEIGGKVYTLLGNILERSEYYDKFLAQYNVNDDVGKNVERIREHIAHKGYRLAKNSFISGFQQVLMSLLLEKQRLLGDKSARESVNEIEGFLTNINGEAFQPLIANLMPMLKESFSK